MESVRMVLTQVRSNDCCVGELGKTVAMLIENPVGYSFDKQATEPTPGNATERPFVSIRKKTVTGGTSVKSIANDKSLAVGSSNSDRMPSFAIVPSPYGARQQILYH